METKVREREREREQEMVTDVGHYGVNYVKASERGPSH